MVLIISGIGEGGIPPKDIVAMQGHFAKDINKAMFKMYNASVIITKDSGKKGGTDTKISAALSLNIPVVIIRRPVSQVDYEVVYSCERVLNRVSEVLN